MPLTGPLFPSGSLLPSMQTTPATTAGQKNPGLPSKSVLQLLLLHLPAESSPKSSLGLGLGASFNYLPSLYNGLEYLIP